MRISHAKAAQHKSWTKEAFRALITTTVVLTNIAALVTLSAVSAVSMTLRPSTVQSQIQQKWSLWQLAAKKMVAWTVVMIAKAVPTAML